MNEMDVENTQDKPCGKVEAVSSTSQRIVEIHLGGSVIRTTADNPFYVQGKGWVSAAELLGATSEGAAVSPPAASEQPMPDHPRPNFPVIGFAAGTPILTPEGSKPIEDIRPGDLIQTQPDDCEDNHEEECDGDRTDEDERWWEWN